MCDMSVWKTQIAIRPRRSGEKKYFNGYDYCHYSTKIDLCKVATLWNMYECACWQCACSQ